MKKMAVNENSLRNLKPIQKGEVRNPGGRPKKTYQTAMRLALNKRITQEEADKLVNIWLENIYANNKHSVEYMKILVDRCVVVPRDEPIQVPLVGKNSEEMAQAVALSIENGEMTATEASQLSTLISTLYQTNESTVINEQLRLIHSVAKNSK